MGVIVSQIKARDRKKGLKEGECGTLSIQSFIVGICRNKLLFGTELECNHSFCYYCIQTWKKVGVLNNCHIDIFQLSLML